MDLRLFITCFVTASPSRARTCGRSLTQKKIARLIESCTETQAFRYRRRCPALPQCPHGRERARTYRAAMAASGNRGLRARRPWYRDHLRCRLVFRTSPCSRNLRGIRLTRPASQQHAIRTLPGGPAACHPAEPVIVYTNTHRAVSCCRKLLSRNWPPRSTT